MSSRNLIVNDARVIKNCFLRLKNYNRETEATASFIWLAFFLLLFGAERRLMKVLISQQTAPQKAFKRMSILHWFMLSLT